MRAILLRDRYLRKILVDWREHTFNMELESVIYYFFANINTPVALDIRRRLDDEINKK